MARLKLWFDDVVKARDVTFRVVAITSESVEIETVRGGVLEINTDETHPDEQVAADSRDPNAVGIQPWTWPEWLTCEAIAKDEDGRWYGYASDDIEVDVRSGRWTTSDEFFELAMFVRLDLPGNVQWDYSAIRNPHKK